jgi:hypothetical protein
MDALEAGEYELRADKTSVQLKAGLSAPIEALYPQLDCLEHPWRRGHEESPHMTRGLPKTGHHSGTLDCEQGMSTNTPLHMQNEWSRTLPYSQPSAPP